MLFNKKGVRFESEHLAELILAVIVLIILVGGVIFFKTSETSAHELICKISIQVSDTLGGITEKLPGGGILLCQTISAENKDNTKEKVLKDIAEHMRKCWNMWGEGTSDPKGKAIWGYSGNKCFTCYKLSFPNLKEKISMHDLYNYLREERENDKLKGEDSYWNYFKRNAPDTYVNIFLSSDDQNVNENSNIIRSDISYAVVYNEHIDTDILKHIVSRAYLGAKVGGAALGTACFFGLTPLSAPLCVPVGAGLGAVIAVTGDTLIIGGHKIYDHFAEKSIDGIYLTTFDSASQECRTIVRGGSTLKEKEDVKRKSPSETAIPPST